MTTDDEPPADEELSGDGERSHDSTQSEPNNGHPNGEETTTDHDGSQDDERLSTAPEVTPDEPEDDTADRRRESPVTTDDPDGSKGDADGERVGHHRTRWGMVLAGIAVAIVAAAGRYLGYAVPAWVYWLGILVAFVGIVALAVADRRSFCPGTVAGPLLVAGGVLGIGYGIERTQILAVAVGIVVAVFAIALTAYRPSRDTEATDQT